MTKELLACDVDEVFFPLLGHFLEDYNATHGTNITPDQFKTYHFDGPLGLTVPQTVEKIYSFLRSDHSQIELLEGVEDAIERLEKRFDMHVVTARHPDFETATWQWLQQRLPDKFKGIKLIGYAPIIEKPTTKAHVCKGLGAVALIDDSIDHVLPCAEEGIEGILFGDYPWNQADILPAGVSRCPTWQDVPEHFNV